MQDLGKQYHIGGPAAAYSTLRETIMELARKPLRSSCGIGQSREKTGFFLHADLR